MLISSPTVNSGHLPKEAMEVVGGGGGGGGGGGEGGGENWVIRITLYGGLVGPPHPSGGALSYAVV